MTTTMHNITSTPTDMKMYFIDKSLLNELRTNEIISKQTGKAVGVETIYTYSGNANQAAPLSVRVARYPGALAGEASNTFTIQLTTYVTDDTSESGYLNDGEAKCTITLRLPIAEGMINQTGCMQFILNAVSLIIPSLTAEVPDLDTLAHFAQGNTHLVLG